MIHLCMYYNEINHNRVLIGDKRSYNGFLWDVFESQI